MSAPFPKSARSRLLVVEEAAPGREAVVVVVEPGDPGYEEAAGPRRGLLAEGRGPAKFAFDPDQSRAPTRYESRVDFAQVARELDEAAGSAREGIRAALLRARDVLLGRMRTVLARGLDVGDVRGLALPLVGEVEAAVGAMLEGAYARGGEALRREVGVEERKDHATVPNVKPAAALRYLKTKKFWIAGVVEDELLKNARGVLLSAIETGELAGETMAKLLGVFEPWVGDETKVRDGEVVEPYRLETVVRTNVTDAYNRGRLVEGREAGELLVGFQYSAVLDDRTTEICRELDGKVFRPGDPALDQVKPPNHFNCRSVLVPITIDTPVEEDDFATAEDVGAARDLMDPGFGGAA